MTDFVTIVTWYQGQKIRFSNPTVLQSDGNFPLTNRVGLSRLDCTYHATNVALIIASPPWFND